MKIVLVWDRGHHLRIISWLTHLDHLFDGAVLRTHIMYPRQTILLLDGKLIEGRVLLVAGGEGHKLLILAHRRRAHTVLAGLLLSLLHHRPVVYLVLLLDCLRILDLVLQVVPVYRWVGVRVRSISKCILFKLFHV